MSKDTTINESKISASKGLPQNYKFRESHEILIAGTKYLSKYHKYTHVKTAMIIIVGLFLNTGLLVAEPFYSGGKKTKET